MVLAVTGLGVALFVNLTLCIRYFVSLFVTRKMFLSLRPAKLDAARFRNFLHPPAFASSNVFATRLAIDDFLTTFLPSKYRVGVD